jgi:acetyl esterase/lipase
MSKGKHVVFLILFMMALSPIAEKVSGAQSAVSSPTQQLPLDPSLDIITLPLWDKTLPASETEAVADMPTLTVFLPQRGRGNGTAVIVAPGGAYISLASNLEGRQVADWFTARGVTAFVLKYRYGPKNVFPIPLEDAQRAIRLVRSYARRYDLSPQRVGMIGFSAGGHLAATAGTLFQEENASSADPVDRLSDRPDFLILGYPWLNAMQPNHSRLITYCSIPTIPEDQCKAFEQRYTPSLHVTGKTPPTFIYATSDDAAVPVSGSVTFYSALIAAGVSAELHLFRHGAHGSGLGAGDAALDMWPGLLEEWLRDQGLLRKDVLDESTGKGASAPTPVGAS